jgi:hypothetical protein
MRGSRFGSLLCVALLAVACCANLSASAIFGTFNIAGTLFVTQNTITWVNNDTGSTADKATVGPGATGSFAGVLNTGAIITIKDLNRATEPTTNPDTTFTPQLYVSFDGTTLPMLNINEIFHGFEGVAGCAASPPAVMQACTPDVPGAPSPFNFVNNPPPAPFGPQATATFVFTGLTADGLSRWQANFTSQFTVPFQTVLAGFGPTSTVSNTYSGSFTVTALPPPGTPEPPASALMGLGLGLLGLGAGLRHRLSRRRVKLS